MGGGALASSSPDDSGDMFDELVTIIMMDRNADNNNDNSNDITMTMIMYYSFRYGNHVFFSYFLFT